MIASFESTTSLPEPLPAHDWWVYAGAAGTKRSFLLLLCRVTAAGATVYDPTDEELAAAMGPQGFKYQWSDESRLVLDGEGGVFP